VEFPLSEYIRVSMLQECQYAACKCSFLRVSLLRSFTVTLSIHIAILFVIEF